MGPQATDLEPISDRKIVERILQYAFEFKEFASCFRDAHGLRFESTIQAFNPTTLFMELEITQETFDALSVKEARSLDEAPNVLRISFAVNNILYFGHARVESRQTRKINISLDLPLYKLQRRDAMRIRILNEHKATITVDKKAYIPHDLSASGLSFVVMPDEEPLFPLRRMIQGCELRFLSIKTAVNLEVVGVNRLRKDNERLLKIGFRFLGLSPAIEQKLSREAYLHTHKIWSRWI